MWRNRFYTSSPIFPGICMIYIIHINTKGFKASPELTLLNLFSDVKSRYLSKFLKNLAADWHLQRGPHYFLSKHEFVLLSLFFTHHSFHDFTVLAPWKFTSVSISSMYQCILVTLICKEQLWKPVITIVTFHLTGRSDYLFTVCHTEVYYFRCGKYRRSSFFSAALYIGHPQLLGLSLSHSTQCWTRIPRRKNQASQK